MKGASCDTQFKPSLTVVDYIDLVPDDPYDWEGAAAIIIPEGPRRAVVHFRYDASVASPSEEWVNVDNSRAVREVVFVLWPLSPVDVPVSKMQFLFSAISQVGAGWRETRETRSITLVGMEMCGALMDVESFWDSVEDCFKNPDDGEWFEDFEGEYRHHSVRFVTRQQWWDEIGERKEVEGVWPAPRLKTVHEQAQLGIPSSWMMHLN